MTNIELLRSLSKEASALKSGVDPEKKEADPSQNGYTLTLAEYPDFIIAKQTPRQTKYLIVMPSANCAFIKTDNGKSEPVSEILSEDNYVAFTSGMPDIKLPEGFWTPALTKGKGTATRLLTVIRDEKICEMLRKKAFPATVDLLAEYSRYCRNFIDVYLDAYKEYPNIYLEYMDKPKSFKLLVDEPTFCRTLIDMFGLENMRDFLNNFELSLVDISSYRSGRESLVRMSSVCRFEFPERAGERNSNICTLPRIKMKYSTFRDYFLYDSVRMGFGLNIANFIQTWRDTLDMEYKIYGKLNDKYPSDLLLVHNQLSYKMTLMQEKIDEYRFNSQCDEASKYEGICDEFVFVAPKKKQDFYDEATAQSNCLAGYVSRFTEGNCLIIFMRHAKTPDKSYITVEIVNGDVAQAKLAYNHEPSTYEKSILYKWIAKCEQKAKEQIA